MPRLQLIYQHKEKLTHILTAGHVSPFTLCKHTGGLQLSSGAEGQEAMEAQPAGDNPQRGIKGTLLNAPFLARNCCQSLGQTSLLKITGEETCLWPPRIQG